MPKPKTSTPAQVLRQLAEQCGGIAGLARRVGVVGKRPIATVWAWIDRNHVPPEHAAKIEREMAGAVSVEQLTRGVRWRRIANPDWPHPLGEPVISVAKSEVM